MHLSQFATLITFDFPQHYNNPSDEDLTLENLLRITNEVIDYLNANFEQKIILVGHSMGGAVAGKCAETNKIIKGAIIIDVVEGTAIQALGFMEDLVM